jgi:hypothetical protein
MIVPATWWSTVSMNMVLATTVGWTSPSSGANSPA